MNKESSIVKWLKRIVSAFLGLFITIVGLVCLNGLVVSIHSFVENQQVFNKAYSDAAASIVNLPPSEKAAAQISIDHLEKLQQIQKNAASGDVMSFLYSTLSTILVGLCAGFVAKSYQNAEKAKNSVDEAKKNSEISKESAKKAKENAEASTKAVKKAEEAVEKIEQSNLEISKFLDTVRADTKNTEASYKEALLQIQKQKDTMGVLNIHIEIVHARASLLSYDKIGANQKIYIIYRLVIALTNNIDHGVVFQLQQELLSLKTAVEQFREYAENITDGGKKTSLLQAITRYECELDKAIKHCDKLSMKFHNIIKESDDFFIR